MKQKQEQAHIIVPGGLHAPGPLYRDGEVIPACSGGGQSDQEDPNAPVLYFVGSGFGQQGVTLLWQNGALATSDGIDIAPLNQRMIVDGYNSWDPYEEAAGADLERYRQVLPAVVAGHFTIDGKKARIERAAVFVRMVDGFGVDSDTYTLFSARAIDPQISGTATLDDATTVTFSGIGAFGAPGDGGIEMYYQITFDGDLTGRSVVSIELDDGPEKMRVFIAQDTMIGGEAGH